jgi:hypothetical protein
VPVESHPITFNTQLSVPTSFSRILDVGLASVFSAEHSVTGLMSIQLVLLAIP